MINPSNMRVVDVARLLNSTSFGFVLAQARLYREFRQAEQSLAGRDIGQLPEVVNPDRKAACERNFQLFCESYFPETYALAWSPDHLKVIEKIETAVWLCRVVRVRRLPWTPRFPRRPGGPRWEMFRLETGFLMSRDISAG